MQGFWQSSLRALHLLSKKRDVISVLPRCRYFCADFGFSKNTKGDASSFAVMSFGDGSHGALGLPSSLVGIGRDAYEPTRIPGLPPNILSVSAGHYHSLAVTSGGELWAWGRNNEGQLGRGLTAARDSCIEPKRVEGLTNVRVRAAFGSGVISVAIGDDGSLWVWGRSKRGQLGLGKGIIGATVPSRVEVLAGEEISKVSLGWGHTLAQTVDGKLYGWGYSADGRLGQLGGTLESSPLDSLPDSVRRCEKHSRNSHKAVEKFVLESMEEEDHMPIIWEPLLFEELRSVEVVDIACGLDHSLVLCRDGTLLSGGSNVYGQLGRAREDLGLLPVDIPFQPVSVACGLGHSMAICHASLTNGKENVREVLTWGWNHNSQLGRGGPESLPLVVEGLEYDETPASLSGGRAHSLALTSRGGLWVWGCGRSGRLGLGSPYDEPEPMLVDTQGKKIKCAPIEKYFPKDWQEQLESDLSDCVGLKPEKCLKHEGNDCVPPPSPTKRLGRKRERGGEMGLLSNKVGRDALKPGDHIYTWKHGYVYSHHGIYVGENRVIHFTRGADQEVGTGTMLDRIMCSSSSSTHSQAPCQECGDQSRLSGVISSCLDCFLCGGELYCFEYGVSPAFFLAKARGGTCTLASSDPPENVLHRASYLLENGFGVYSIFKNNCEDFAIYCKTELLVLTSVSVGRSGQATAFVAAEYAVMSKRSLWRSLLTARAKMSQAP
ncbi:hypothetical protein Nepgr_010569 [Nepenthes gracilis]|uniref:LRAT domain-containing protein n=1 Tax=Nepenthes gracilis TaxID=150966 RepID=A0AAD3XLG2_NEPGR|nr:hypothetical protein Nepgr_010569 [Nepenthes gracilis]